MKRYLSLIMVVLFISMSGCKKHHTLPKVPPPEWTTDQTGKYPASMTVVVQVSESLRPYVQKGDKIGAFVGEECRGISTFVETGSVSAFFILVHGSVSEQSKLSFQYYSSWKSHLYKTTAFLDFTADGAYGTADGPQVLNLDPVR